MESECVSCGACVQACPTDALMEKSVLEKGQAERSVVTTCGYCGVGCSFKAEVKGDEVVRMVPNKDGLPNHGHSCVKGRFAWGYATHPDRVTQADDSRAHRPDPGARCRGKRRSSCAAAGLQANAGASTVAARSAGSPPRDAPTRKLTWCRSWCAPRSATTTSIPARASVIRRPATD